MTDLKLLSQSAIFNAAQAADTQALANAVNALNTTLQTALTLKANATDLSTLSTTVGTKANQTDIINLNSLITNLSTLVGTKITAAQAPVQSIAGAQGIVTLAQIGLDQVNNTSDANKPISAATGTALGLKANTTDLLQTNRGLVSTFDAAPSIILPSSTPILNIQGKTTAGDFGDGAYRAVASQPSHQGYILVGGQYYELMGAHVSPDQFIRTGDTDHYAAFQRASDYMTAKNIVNMQLNPVVYNTSSGSLTFGVAPQIIGTGSTESGVISGINPGGSYGETVLGTVWICGSTSNYAINLANYNNRGSYMDRIQFAQIQATPASGWKAANYMHIINLAGGILETGRLMFSNVSRGINASTSGITQGRLKLGQTWGQFFNNFLYLDNAQDITYIDMVHNFPFWSSNANVSAYTQANLDLIRIGRADGIHGGKIFSIMGQKTLSFENLANNGPATNVYFDSIYSDYTQNAIYSNNTAYVTVGNLVGQGEQSGSASALAGSYPFYGDTNGAGNYNFGRYRAERVTMAGYCGNANTTVNILHPLEALLIGSGQLFKSANGSPVFRLNTSAGLIDTSVISYGTQGVDYVATDDEIVYEYGTTANSSGNVTIAHGLGLPLVYSIKDAFAVGKGPSGEAVFMPMTSCDGTNIGFGNSNANLDNTPVRITIRTRRFANPAW